MRVAQAILIGSMTVVGAMALIGTVLLLPIWVCYRLLSVEFLAQFHPDFDLFRPLPEDDDDGPGDEEPDRITGLA